MGFNERNGGFDELFLADFIPKKNTKNTKKNTRNGHFQRIFWGGSKTFRGSAPVTKGKPSPASRATVQRPPPPGAAKPKQKPVLL